MIHSQEEKPLSLQYSSEIWTLIVRQSDVGWVTTTTISVLWKQIYAQRSHFQIYKQVGHIHSHIHTGAKTVGITALRVRDQG